MPHSFPQDPSSAEPVPASERRYEFLPFSPPSIGEDEIAEVVAALRSDWITTGPRTQAFAAAFAEATGAPAALPLNSCTAGLHTALKTLGIGPGDEVISTPMTFAASVNVIEHVGATPRLADVEPDTLNIDPALVERAMSPKTRAIIAVHYAGHPAELDALRALAQSANVALIEDCAHAFPATYRGVRIGSGANPAAFSFYATKNLTTGEGGMLTGGEEFIDRARVVSLHGMDRDAWKRYSRGGTWKYDVVLPGFKYNMTDIQAAMGLAQLTRIDAMQQRRAEIVAAYREGLAGVEALELPAQRPHVGHAWHLFILRLHLDQLTISRDEVIEALKAENIATAVHYIPIHMHSYYRNKYGFVPADLPVASDAYERMLSLPLHPRLSDADVADVVHAVRRVIARHQR